MSGLAPPPPRLSAKPRILTLPAGLALVRFYDPRRGDWHTQRPYGPLPDMRFDHHPPPCRLHPDRSVWYAATSLRGAVAEVFGRQGFVDRAAGVRVAKATVRGELRVLDLVGIAARAVGLTQQIAATSDYTTCQQWARAFYEGYRQVQGLRWRGRQSGSLCVMFHDRANREPLAAQSWSITDPAVWPRIARSARECRLTIV